MDKIMGLPGVRAARVATPRSYILNRDQAKFLPKNLIVDGTLSRDVGNSGDEQVLRAGKLLGKITATGKYRPSIICRNTVAYADDDTTITVGVPGATEIARLLALAGGSELDLKFIGPPTAAGVVAETAIKVTGVDVAAGKITVGDLNLNKVAGSFITPADGSEYPRTLVPEGYGLKVTDQDEKSEDQELAEVLVDGVIDASQIIDYPTDPALVTWLKDKLRSYAPGLVFDDDF